MKGGRQAYTWSHTEGSQSEEQGFPLRRFILLSAEPISTALCFFWTQTRQKFFHFMCLRDLEANWNLICLFLTYIFIILINTNNWS